ncbi:major facilitator superfamily transporter [Phlyctema vagabunda]|uniref:Major facilitator superfamily transporter n=1 Tax=Phlyctema vagabunda TaxID=108571 RepID=A0ABR4PYQ8_9HELO
MTTGNVAKDGVAISDSITPPIGTEETLNSIQRSASTSSSSSQPTKLTRLKGHKLAKRCWEIISWTPRNCRWDVGDPPKFSMALNLLFGFASTFTVANLYYNHPILNVLAEDFNVSYERVSTIPTVMQAGYAAGLLFLCPLGDILRRRPFVLVLVFCTATIWLGLCITNSFPVFVALSFITAVTTVTPQLMLPLVGDLAPAHKRAAALSIVVSGLLLGMLIARLLSGILTQYTSWRIIYFFSFGVQYLIFILLWFFMPDYPSTNPEGINYLVILLSIIQMFFKHPVLVQACLVSICVSSCFTSFWTTLTFLLAAPPYNYNSTTIGLFALVGIGAMCFGPFYSRLVIDRFVPLFSVILGLTYALTGVIIGTFIGEFTVAGPIIQAFVIDLGLQTSQIANRSAIYTIAPKARNRINTAYMVCVFIGQLMGTAVGSRLYALGGWRASGGASVGFVGLALMICFVRGPWEKGWIGWGGGWELKRRDLVRKEEPAIEQASPAINTAGGKILESNETEKENIEAGNNEGRR